MNFEEKIHTAKAALKLAIELAPSSAKETVSALGYVKGILDELKPDYPTCSTCEFLNKNHDGCFCPRIDIDNHELQGALSSWEAIEIVLPDNFGCIHHSELESKNETN